MRLSTLRFALLVTALLLVSAAPALASTMTVDIKGSGAGEVVGASFGPYTGGEPPMECSYKFPFLPEGVCENTMVPENPGETGFQYEFLKAVPDGESEFVGWTIQAGSSSPLFCPAVGKKVEAPNCLFFASDVSKDAKVTAVFCKEGTCPVTLTVKKTGTGAGAVTSAPSGIECDPGCGEDEADFEEGAEVTLSAEADEASEFTGWHGVDAEAAGCDSSGATLTCVVTMAEAEEIEAEFTSLGPSLTIDSVGSGSGQVNCVVNGGERVDEPCEPLYPEGTELELIAAQGEHSEFAGFEDGSGDTSGCATSPCGPFTLGEDSELDVRFELIPHTLTVEATGEGSVDADSGAVSGCEEGGGTCSGEYGESETVTLTASPGEHKEVVWTSGCDNVPSADVCEVEITEGDATVQADFVAVPQGTLTVEPSGEGSVTAEASPAPASGGIFACEQGGGACSAVYYQGETVTLAATPGAHRGTAWSGCDHVPSADECEVELDGAAVGVEVEFAQIFHALTIDTAGSGAGSVGCDGGACAPSYVEGAEVTLTAAAAPGSTFAGWLGGGCSGAGACAVTMSAVREVTATFSAIPTYALTIDQVGPGSGTVLCDGGACASSYRVGTVVRLSAAPAAGSAFYGWSGAGCAGAVTCVVTLGADTTVAAAFELANVEGSGEEAARPCGALADRLRALSQRNRALRRRARGLLRRAHRIADRNPRRARVLRGKGRRLTRAARRRARSAQGLSRRTKRCRRSNR